MPIRPSTLRLVAVVYAVKALLIGIAWLVVPDLPERAASHVRQTRRGWAAIPNST